MTLRPVGRFLRSAGQFIFWFRKFFLAIPVIVVAILLAKQNLAQLPDYVGLILSRAGTYSIMVPKAQAVLWPLYITGGSLLLMCFSRKVFYPWLISIITLVIPVLIRLLNVYF